MRNNKKETSMQQLECKVNGEFIELNQLLKIAGICDSGGAGKMLVATGKVRVDNKVELRKTCKIRPGQTVVVDNFRIHVTTQ
jgi:ribosome-associated protein